jgi:hypothetical protein
LNVLSVVNKFLPNTLSIVDAYGLEARKCFNVQFLGTAAKIESDQLPVSPLEGLEDPFAGIRI